MFSFRPRSHSVSGSTSLSGTSGESKGVAKRGSSLLPAGSREGRRNGKRRGQNGSVFRLNQSPGSATQWGLIPSVDLIEKTLDASQDSHLPGRPPDAQSSRLATTSAEFDLFPKTPQKNGNTWRHGSTAPLVRPTSGHDDLEDLVHLRSTAFWELRRSIAENGEGLVRRMRDFERSRSRHHVHQKAKEAEKRGRKRNSPRRKRHAFPMASDGSSEDEEVEICSGEPSILNVFSNYHERRPHSLDSMDVDNYPLGILRADGSRGIPVAPQHERCNPVELSLEDGLGVSPSILEFDLSFPPSLSHSTCESPNSSTISLPLTVSSNPMSPDSGLCPSFPSMASEKAVAVINLALANGAGGLNDYSSLLEFQDRLQLDVYDNNGDLWH